MADGYWVVDGQVVYLTAQTEIKDTISVGDTVRVQAMQDANGSLTALQIEKVSGEDSSSEEGDGSDATETAEPQETETPGSEASETVEPEENETPEPSKTPEPDETEEATETPGP